MFLQQLEIYEVRIFPHLLNTTGIFKVTNETHKLVMSAHEQAYPRKSSFL